MRVMDGPWGPWRVHEGQAGSMRFNEVLVWFMDRLLIKDKDHGGSMMVMMVMLGP